MLLISKIIKYKINVPKILLSKILQCFNSTLYHILKHTVEMYREGIIRVKLWVLGSISEDVSVTALKYGIRNMN